jgi:GNAT superfamily N-acetyltransferase
VLVLPDSPICPNGWIGVLEVTGLVTATVPTEGLRDEVALALSRLSAEQAVSPQALLRYLSTMNEVLGPASLFYAEEFVSTADLTQVKEVAADELATLLDDASPEDVEQSGLGDLTGTAFVSRAGGAVAAACGYRLWPNGVAHLGVLTSPHHRREGHGQRVATAAILRALADGLLPQWRARRTESQLLAARLGLVKLGTQLSVRPS